MAGLLELLDDPVAAPAAPADTGYGRLGVGMRSGLPALYSGLNQFAGGAAEALGGSGAAREFNMRDGLNAFAQGRYAAAARQQNEAGTAAQEGGIPTWQDVKNSQGFQETLRNAVNMGTGMLGQSIPQMLPVIAATGLAAATRGGSLRTLAAGAAANTPFMAGQQIGELRADPVGAQMDPATRFAVGAGSGAVQAGLMQAPLSMVGGRLLGMTGKEAAGKGLAGLTMRALQVPLAEGGTMGVQNAVQQGTTMAVNPDKKFDYDQFEENVAGGALAGTIAGAPTILTEGISGNASRAAAGIGKARDAVTGLAGRTSDAVKTGVEEVAADPRVVAATEAAKDLGGKAVDAAQTGVDAVKERAGPAVDAAMDVGGKAADAAADIPDQISKLWDTTSRRASDYVDKVANSDEFLDAKAFVGAQGKRLTDLIAQDDGKRLDTVKAWADDLSQQALGPEKAAALKEAMTDLADRGNQAVVAGLKKGQDAYQTAAQHVGAFAESVGSADKTTPGNAKQSADYSGIRQAIDDAVVPILSKSRPELFQDPKLRDQLADALRKTVLGMRDGKPPSSDTLASLMDVAGDKAGEVLRAVHRTMGEQDPATNERVYRALNDVQAQQEARGSLLEVLRKNLLPEHADTPDPVLQQTARGLSAWADRPAATPAQEQYNTQRMKTELSKVFGKDADTVLAAVEKNRQLEQSRMDANRQKFDEEGNPIGEEDSGLTTTDAPTQMSYFGGGNKRGELMLSAEHDPGKGGYEPAAVQAMKRAQKLNPDSTVRFATASEIGFDHPAVQRKLGALRLLAKKADLTDGQADKYAHGEIDKYGMIATEKAAQETRLSFDELDKMRLDTDKYPKSPSRIDVGDPDTKGSIKLDANRVMRFMNARYKDMNYGGSIESTTGRLRAARNFMDGIAAVQDHLGRSFEIPDSTVIAKGLTWGDAQKLDVRTEGDKATDADTSELVKLRAQYQEASKNLKGKEKALAQDTLREKARDIAGKRDFAKIKEQLIDEAPRSEQEQEVDPFGQVHQALKGRDEVPGAEIRTDSSGLPRGEGGRALEAPNAPTFEARKPDGKPSAAREALAAKAEKADRLATLDHMLAKEDYSALTTRPRVDAFLAKAKERYEQLQQADKVALDNDTRLSPTQQKALATLENMFGRDGTTDLESFYDGVPDEPGAPPSPKERAAKTAAFLERARSGDTELHATLAGSDDAKGLHRAAVALQGSKDAGSRRTLDVVNARLGELVKDPDTAYGLQTKRYSLESAERVDPNAAGPVDRQATADYLKRVLGDSVKLHWDANLLHAGEFERVMGPTGAEDMIRLSVHALNPGSTAHHEALHALFAKLSGAGQGDIMDVLNRAASTATVTNQLRTLLANEPEALKQLGNAEERAAYMYQFHAAGKLQLGTKATTVLGHIAEFVRSVLGVWSNDQRALHILNYFHSGEFAKNMNDPSAVHRALMESGSGKALTLLKNMTEPFRQLSENLAVAGGQRIRDTGIPALNELADRMKLATTAEGGDAGFLPTARAEHSQRRNRLAADLHGYTDAQMSEALEAMQRGVKPATPEARLVRTIVNKHLASALQYMKDAGVRVDAIGADGASYFPRIWDADYISSHQSQFLGMLDKYVQSGELKGDPKALMQRLMVTDGAEFSAEVDKPGMQFAKQRKLSFISHEDAAAFMNKNFYQTMNSYLGQATRRAEWARRFGDDGGGLAELMERAQQQGATKDQMDSAYKYVRAVDGTLGDTINPTARRLFGNVMVYQNLRLLPLAIFSSVVDPLGINVRGGTVGDAFSTFKRGVRETVNNFRKDNPPDEMTKLAASLGTVDNAMLVHALGASYTQGMVGNTARRINDTLFRVNLMEQFNTSMRVGATEAALGFMARHADGTASVHSGRWLAELGLQPGDVQLDANGRPKLFQADGLTAEHEVRMRSAMNRWVDGAVLRPDAADKPIWMSDPHFALVSHLKQFVFSFQETILKRVTHEAKAGNYTPAMALAAYVPVMIAADVMKGLIQNGGSEPPWKKNWGAADYLGSGMERAGLFGAGQFGLDMLKDVREGGSGIGTLTGPTVQQLTDAVRVMGGNAEFEPFLIKSMPANALYAAALHQAPTDPVQMD